MPRKRILLDSNAYLRLANSFHPLLHEPFGKDQYALYLIPEFQKEFDRNPRLANKFGWVNQPEYIENRKYRIRVTRPQREQINLIYSYLWPHNISEGLGASPIDVRALAYSNAFAIPVVTDDFQMRKLGTNFGFEVWSLLDLLKIMYKSKWIDISDIKTLLNYLKYAKDLPYPSFEKHIKIFFEGI
ncbi:hypothetical protein D1BOALGB6SA_5301 [Olavius sp. associated proteobacterium Delta 1]|nr:hypothetical protein D1BOALGB6SA_5301 [Olavius sp. associated proteobacterium Delta 1]